MLSQCSKCGLSKSTGPMGSVLPQCQCDWKMPNSQRTWVGLTEEDVNGFVEQYWDDDHMTMRSMMRAIEAKLKELNT
jgi:hypothetical protein